MPSANAYPYSKVHPRSRREYVDSIRENLSNQGSPRIRGEYEKASGTSGWYYGSPPHLRGIYRILRTGSCRNRFTPASAGNMNSYCIKFSPRRVHPRIRGEYNHCWMGGKGQQGSPPHPRRIYFDRIKQHETYRFTPASAGNMYVK